MRNINCIDCGIRNTVTFMVHDYLWAELVGGTFAGGICVPCFEKRLGRKLTKEDLMDIPCNQWLINELSNG